MRLLFITNYYPPSDHGWGYMQLCEEVANGLAVRGHEIEVLTSTQRDGPEIARPYPVHRLLTLEPDWYSERPAAWQFFVGRRRRERQAIACLQHLVAVFQPQVIFIWHAIGLPRVLLQKAEQNAPTVYYLAGYLPELSDEYIAYWHAQPVRGSARLLKPALARVALAILRQEGKPVPLQYEHVICVSGYVRRRLVEQGLIPENSVVIYNGIDVGLFSSKRFQRSFDGHLTLLCAGRLERDKGVHDVIEALACLRPDQRSRIACLDIVGDGQPAYVACLHEMVEKHELSGIVRFLKPVSRDQIPALLDSYDVLIQPSALEALSRMVQEAMAVGLLVIGTTTGGSGELLEHERTGLAFKAGEIQSLVRQMERAASEPDTAARLAAAGQARVCEAFSIDHTVSKIDIYLSNLLRGRG